MFKKGFFKGFSEGLVPVPVRCINRYKSREKEQIRTGLFLEKKVLGIY
jgi:hypothetical protein